MNENLDKHVWVTGAGHKNGIGYAIVDELRNDGYDATIFDIDYDKGVTGIYCDITSEQQVKFAFETEEPKYYPCAIVNCAGINITGIFMEYTMEDYANTLKTNVAGAFLFAREFVKATKDCKAPKYIINIGSDSGTTPRTNSFAYCSSKSAVQMLTRCEARDLAPLGYRAICLDPSYVLGTNMNTYITKTAAKLQGLSEEEISKKRSETIPLKRGCSPKEVAVWVPFILKSGEYANGACIRITGGVQ